MVADRPDAGQEQVGVELGRVVRRWQQLPLDRALSVVPAVRELTQRLADEVADAHGYPRAVVPDLGPAVLLDQLRVMVHDHTTAGLATGPLLTALTALRRALP